MRLYEWEGKALLARHGVPVPRGARWREGEPAPWMDGWLAADGYVVKAQTLEGGRGKRGGVRPCADATLVETTARALIGSTVGGEIVSSVLVEERVDIARELYAAVTIDRDRGVPRLTLGGEGGIDVESASTPVVSMALTSMATVEAYQVRELVRRAGLPADSAPALLPILRGLVDAFIVEDAELIEVNPLALRQDGSPIAVDARIILDDGAAFRQPDRPSGGESGTPFERRCTELGAVGIELDGDIAAIVSGAGLMMATVDLLVTSGGSLRAAVDLGGLVLREAEELADLLVAVQELRPQVILVNAFFQLATCDALARKLRPGLERLTGDMAPLVLRLRGRGTDEARDLLAPYPIFWESDLAAACLTAVSLARQEG